MGFVTLFNLTAPLQFYDGMGSFVITFFMALLASVFCERTIVFIKEVAMGEHGLKKEDKSLPPPNGTAFEV